MRFYSYHSFILALYLSIGIVLRYISAEYIFAGTDNAESVISNRILILSLLAFSIIGVYIFRINPVQRCKHIVKKCILYSLIGMFGFMLPVSVINADSVMQRSFTVDTSGKRTLIETDKNEIVYVTSSKYLKTSKCYRGIVYVDTHASIGKSSGHVESVTVIGDREFSSYHKVRDTYITKRLSSLNKLTSQYFSSLIFGENTKLTYKKKERLRALGISHLFAISGMHIGIIVLLISYAVRFLPIRESRKVWVLILLLCGYALLTSLSASVVRSVIMFSIVSSGSFFYYRYQDSINALCIAFLILILSDSSHLFSAGFQLSFVATFGIIYFSKQYKSLLAQTHIITNILLISLIATLFTAPFLVYHFGSISPFAIFATILISPVVTLFVIVGVLYLVFFSFPGVNGFLRFVLTKVTLFLDWVIRGLYDIVPIKSVDVDSYFYLFVAVPLCFMLYTEYRNRTVL